MCGRAACSTSPDGPQAGATTDTRNHTTLTGWPARVVPVVWVAFFVTSVWVTAYGFVHGVRDPDLLQTPQVGEILVELGIGLRNGILIALVFPAVVYTGSALLMFVRRTRDWMALLFSGTMIGMSAFFSVAIVIPLQAGGLLRIGALVALNGAFVGFVIVGFLFPDGRLYPPWGRWVAPLLVGAILVFGNGPELMSRVIRPEADLDLRASLATIVVAAATLTVVYAGYRRYRDIADDVERQQTKWIIFPFGLGFVYFVVALIIPGFFVEISDRWLGWIMVSAIPLGILFPIAITVAVLKYRLYGIDVVISRTVVYGGLAAFITLIYVGIVAGAGSLVGTGDEPNLALSIAATAVVAVAFQPVRTRLTRLANRLVFGDRATPYEVLSRFSRHLDDTVATDETLGRIAQLLADGTGAARAEVSLAIGGEMRPAAVVGEASDAAETWSAEVTHRGERLGELSITKPRNEALTPQDRKLVDDLAAQVGLLLRNVRLTEELRQRVVDLRESRQRLVAAQDAERRRLERDLHDGAQQQIVALKMKLGIARQIAQGEDAPRTAELMEQLTAETDEAVQTLRDLAHGIYPPLLAAEGLPAALRAHAAKAIVPVEVSADGVGRYDEDTEAAVYFCVLEAIQNATKYAEASHVEVRLEERGGRLGFEVTDDGAGFDPAVTPRGQGTTNMADRLDALGGDFGIESSPGVGTSVTGRVPCERPVRD